MTHPRRPLPHRPRKGQLLLYTVLLLIAIAAACALHNCSLHQGTVVHPREQGDSRGDTIDVALLYGPASYYMYADTLGGYNYDLLRLIARREGVVMKFWPVGGLEEGLRKLESGSYDLLASLPVDADYKARLHYSEPMYLDRQVLVQRRNSAGGLTVSSALDLAGDTVHIEQDSPIAARLANLSREIGSKIHVERHADLSAELLVMMVHEGRIRYAVVNEQVALPLVEKFPELDISSPISFTQFQAAVAAPRDSALMQKFNGWLRSALASPEGRRLKERYHL